jgi:MOSC domain-containing protein YiiM
MKIISVNVGRAQSIKSGKSSGMTGIFKRPADGPVVVTALGLAGDAICDTENHGGVDQAVYVYGVPDYDWWSAELGQTLMPGTFGENITLSDLESTGLSIGDRLHFDQVVLEVTSPRIPCVTLAARMGDPAFVKRFRHAERPGVYCRVIREGNVAPGELVRLESCSGPTISVIEMFHDFYTNEWDEAKIRRYLAAPIAVRDRLDHEARLMALMDEY